MVVEFSGLTTISCWMVVRQSGFLSLLPSYSKETPRWKWKTSAAAVMLEEFLVGDTICTAPRMLSVLLAKSTLVISRHAPANEIDGSKPSAKAAARVLLVVLCVPLGGELLSYKAFCAQDPVAFRQTHQQQLSCHRASNSISPPADDNSGAVTRKGAHLEEARAPGTCGFARTEMSNSRGAA